jgi:hypothetical protein
MDIARTDVFSGWTDWAIVYFEQYLDNRKSNPNTLFYSNVSVVIVNAAVVGLVVNASLLHSGLGT